MYVTINQEIKWKLRKNENKNLTRGRSLYIQIFIESFKGFPLVKYKYLQSGKQYEPFEPQIIIFFTSVGRQFACAAI